MRGRAGPKGDAGLDRAERGLRAGPGRRGTLGRAGLVPSTQWGPEQRRGAGDESDAAVQAWCPPLGAGRCSHGHRGPRTVLITGCSSGIGLRLAVQLAQDPGQRFQVIATMRDLQKREKLEQAAGAALGRTLSIRHLDVCSEASVAQCLGGIPERRVDVLVNNAGVGLIGPIESISIAEMKRVFETNFFGAVRMVRAVLPGMKLRRSGHIVVMSSVMGLQGIVFNDVYAASKFAMEGFCESLAVQLLQFHIFVSLVEPGPVNTDFELKLMEDVSRSEFPGTDPATLRYFQEVYLPASREIFSAMGQSPEDVAK
ncbi:LOW QUALITY PROTEIN: retinol dehydrogenase 8-like, partial [Eretmochelys imbricata]